MSTSEKYQELDHDFTKLNDKFLSAQAEQINLENELLSPLENELVFRKNASNHRVSLEDQRGKLFAFRKQLLSLKTDFVHLGKASINALRLHEAESLKKQNRKEPVLEFNFKTLISDIQNRVSELEVYVQKVNNGLEAINSILSLKKEKKNTKEAWIFFYVSIAIGTLFAYWFYHLSCEDVRENSEKVIHTIVPKIDTITKRQKEIDLKITNLILDDSLHP